MKERSISDSETNDIKNTYQECYKNRLLKHFNLIQETFDVNNVPPHEGVMCCLHVYINYLIAYCDDNTITNHFDTYLKEIRAIHDHDLALKKAQG